jgi:hypothetical protein
MQETMPYSLLVWDDVSNLPFPDEVKPILGAVKWDEFEWHAAGLPMPYAKYGMTGGKSLYLAEQPDGNIKIEKMSEFTGNISIGGFFVDDTNPEGFNYFVNFIVTIVKGEVIEIVMNHLQKQPVKDYQDAMANFQRDISKIIKISDSFWFKWLYRPWFFIVRGIGFCFLFVIKLFKDIVIGTVKFLTPL